MFREEAAMVKGFVGEKRICSIVNSIIASIQHIAYGI